MSNIYIKGFITLVYDELKILVPTKSITKFKIESNRISLDYENENERFKVDMKIDFMLISINIDNKCGFITFDKNEKEIDIKEAISTKQLKEIHVGDFVFMTEKTFSYSEGSIITIRTKD
jgi:hypothetical protein